MDDAIEKTQAVIDQVQVVKRGLMQELLTRDLPGRHTRFRQTEIGEIPVDWEYLPLLNSSILGRLPVALPPEDERTRISSVLEASFEQMQALKRELRGFQTVKRSLTVSVLLTGELRVTPDC